MAALDIGIAFDLKSDYAQANHDPGDRLEEYDSMETVEAIAGALRQAGHRTRLLGGGRRFLQAVLTQPPALVFNIAEGAHTRSREAHVPAVCEMLGVPVTHSDPLTLAMSLDKAMTKRVVAAAGVPTPDYVVCASSEDARRCPLQFPVIAKPLAEGSSIGIRKHSRAKDVTALVSLVGQLVSDYRQPVLVEEFCPGAEFTVGVRGNGADSSVIAAMEIVPLLVPADQFVYGLESKRNYQQEVRYVVPPDRPPELMARVHKVAADAYRALDCRDIARVDIRVDRAGEPKFLEVNPLPGLNPVTGDIVILAERKGTSYERLIQGIVDAAARRYGL